MKTHSRDARLRREVIELKAEPDILREAAASSRRSDVKFSSVAKRGGPGKRIGTAGRSVFRGVGLLPRFHHAP